MDITLDSPPPGPFATALTEWFRTAMRPLPWRETYDPYHVWISEIMLQQTQMERGVRYFKEWMEAFPDIRSVAEAGGESILARWEGLGYYSRANNLHAAAKIVMKDYGGRFPDTFAAIRALPGVGDYTAGAIMAIAFNQPQPAVDANVLRILSRIADIDQPLKNKTVRDAVTDLARSLIPDDSPRLFCQALMELGALVCGKIPRCDACPVRAFCLAHERGTVADRPLKTKKKIYRLINMAAGIMTDGDRVLIRKRPPEGLWSGLWEFPGGPVADGEKPAETVRRVFREELEVAVDISEKIGVVRHSFTTNRVTLFGFFCAAKADVRPEFADRHAGKWVVRDELRKYGFPAGHRKLLEAIGWK